MSDTLLGPLGFGSDFNNSFSNWADQETARQNKMKAAGNLLAGNSSVGQVDFQRDGLIDTNLAQLYNARRDTILTKKAMPGQSQTLLSNPVRSL